MSHIVLSCQFSVVFRKFGLQIWCTDIFDATGHQVAIADEDGKELGMSKAAGQMGASANSSANDDHFRE